MHEKVMRNLERVPLTSLHLPQEVLTVELIDLLNVPKDDAALPPQGLRYIWALELRDVVLYDILQGQDIVPLCLYHLPHDVGQCSVKHKGVKFQFELNNVIRVATISCRNKIYQYCLNFLKIFKHRLIS